MYNASIQNARGLTPNPIHGWETPRGRAFARGELAQLDIANSDSAVTNNKENDAASGLCNVIMPNADAESFCPSVVFDASTSQNVLGKTWLCGHIKVRVGEAVVKGDKLVARDGSALLWKADASGQKVLAVALEAGSTLVTAAFDGEGGWGVHIE